MAWRGVGLLLVFYRHFVGVLGRRGDILCLALLSSAMGAWVGPGCGGRGCVVGRAGLWGVLARLLGTYLSCATWTFTNNNSIKQGHFQTLSGTT